VAMRDMSLNITTSFSKLLLFLLKLSYFSCSCKLQEAIFGFHQRFHEYCLILQSKSAENKEKG
jgi:hypothetical protein